MPQQPAQTSSQQPPRHITILLFDGFELLDVAGPVEVWSQIDGLELEYVTLDGQPARSSQGAVFQADRALVDTALADTALASNPQTSTTQPNTTQPNASGHALLIPGGMGTRTLIEDPDFLQALTDTAKNATLLTSVCTGSALLAAAGLLDGYRATTNKRAYDWATSFGSTVEWQRRARWVHDRDRWTSSGVAAGMDMACAFVAHYWGAARADAIAHAIELRAQTDPEDDPFA
ncbi:DJ-1/PfpI family protein [Corynebacterium sp. 320]|nr:MULTISPECIES: DJ-1/PfpI family protein [Corynebacterium]KAB1550537.1 DJ-1/PfpI family protein [Corynebacterium sp. 319]KAB1554846.1 DJ-1/PfpI family protein [Corynebacterium sp. 321]KAB1502725.1 DJ-1/PfpI family protein [Corynebacterium sp. 320]KAB3526388.1 DJ-1/PfpI family protein [Corynebacterium sp. 250]KAB3537767.1 DJ-1/PfpI family protein [Corynebacterium sp. 366]